MARASTVTAVSLDQFAAIMGIHPLAWNACFVTGSIQFGEMSELPKYQYSWQGHDHLGLESVAYGLFQAEQAMIRELGWYPRPTFITNEVRYNLTQWKPVAAYGTVENSTDRDILVPDWKKLISGGTQTSTQIAAAASLAYTDGDGDGFSETWTLTGTIVEGTTTDEIAVYYASADRFAEDRSEKWRIRPVIISISGTTVTVKGKRWQVVKPAVYEKLNPGLDEGIDLTDAANSVTTLEVMRHTINTTTAHVNLNWQNNDPSTGWLSVYDKHSFIPYQGDYGVNTVAFPETSVIPKLVYSYVAGLPTDPHGNVELELAIKICQFAVGFLPRNLGGAIPTVKAFDFYQADMADPDKPRNLPYTPDEFWNPFGTWRGAMEAWRYVKHLKRTYGDE